MGSASSGPSPLTGVDSVVDSAADSTAPVRFPAGASPFTGGSSSTAVSGKGSSPGSGSRVDSSSGSREGSDSGSGEGSSSGSREGSNSGSGARVDSGSGTGSCTASPAIGSKSGAGGSSSAIGSKSGAGGSSSAIGSKSCTGGSSSVIDSKSCTGGSSWDVSPPGSAFNADISTEISEISGPSSREPEALEFSPVPGAVSIGVGGGSCGVSGWGVSGCVFSNSNSSRNVTSSEEMTFSRSITRMILSSSMTIPSSKSEKRYLSKSWIDCICPSAIPTTSET